MLFLQEEVVKTKRMQSIGEVQSLLPTPSSLHSRPSIGGLGSSDTVDVEDDIPSPALQAVDTSINKSPVNASNSEYFCFFLIILIMFYIFFSHLVLYFGNSFLL